MPSLNLFLFLTLALTGVITYHLYNKEQAPRSDAQKKRQTTQIISADWEMYPSRSNGQQLTCGRDVVAQKGDFWNVALTEHAYIHTAPRLQLDFIEQSQVSVREGDRIVHSNDCA